MSPFPLVGPPATPGVYLIKNKKTGQIYVGASSDLRTRYSVWRGVFSSGLRAPNRELDIAVRATKPEDWEFHVFEECDKSDLFRIEREVIQKVVTSIGNLCLNSLLPYAGGPTASAQSVPLSTILDETGKNMNYAEAAIRVGCARETIKKRLAKWRKAGKTTLHITELL